MRHLRGAMLALVLASCVGSDGGDQTGQLQQPGVGPGGGQTFLTICHVPEGNPDNPQTLVLPLPAVLAHLAEHAFDYLGPCIDDDDDGGGGDDDGGAGHPPDDGGAGHPPDDGGGGAPDDGGGDGCPGDDGGDGDCDGGDVGGHSPDDGGAGGACPEDPTLPVP